MKQTDDTDPLALIVAALRAATDAAQEAAIAAKRAAIAATDAKDAVDDPTDGLAKKISAVEAALIDLTTNREALQQARADRYFWAVMSFMIGIPAGVGIVSYGPPLWQRLFG